MSEYGEFEQVNGAIANRLQRERDALEIKIRFIKSAVKDAFGETPFACDGALIVRYEKYNAIVDALNSAENDSFSPNEAFRAARNEAFWAVWREKGGASPSKRHKTKADAIAEAVRLTQQANERYFVLEVIGIVAVRKSPVDYIEFD